MINNMISISLDGKPCVSEAYSVLFIYNFIDLILVRVERKSLIRKTLILIRVPFTIPPDNIASVVTFTAFYQDIPASSIWWLSPFHVSTEGTGGTEKPRDGFQEVNLAK